MLKHGGAMSKMTPDEQLMQSFFLDAARNMTNLQEELMACADEYPRAYETQLDAQKDLKDAEQDLKDFLNSYVMDLEFASKEDDSPLKGLAKTSSAYKTAVEVAKASCVSGDAYDLRECVQDNLNRYMQAEIELHREKTKFVALRAVIDGASSLLRAMAR